jgi:hypothetical protein
MLPAPLGASQDGHGELSQQQPDAFTRPRVPPRCRRVRASNSWTCHGETTAKRTISLHADHSDLAASLRKLHVITAGSDYGSQSL